jgi:hypothetical protein
VIIRALDSNGDITFGQGQQNYLVNQSALALNIQTRLLSFLNNCVWDMSSGIDWFTYLRQPNNQNQIIISVRTCLLQSFGVLKVNTVNVNVVGRHIALAYNVTTIYTSNFSAVLQNLEELLLNANSQSN